MPGGNVLDKGARVVPVPKVDGRRAPDAAEVDDEAEDDEEDDEEDLEDGKDELDLAKEADKREAHGQGQQDKGDDPDGGVDVGPELEEHADGGDFRGDGQDVAVDEVPADGEAPGRVDEELGVPHKGARDGEQRGDLAQGELDGADDEADGGVAEQRAERTAALHGAAQAEEQAGSDGARDAEHGQMPLGEPALEMAALAGRDEIAGVIVVAVVIGVVVVSGPDHPRRSILPLNVGRETRVVGRARNSRRRRRRRRPVALGAVVVHDGCVVAPGAFCAGKKAPEGHGKMRLATGNKTRDCRDGVSNNLSRPTRRGMDRLPWHTGTANGRCASKQRTLSTLRPFSRALFFLLFFFFVNFIAYRHYPLLTGWCNRALAGVRIATSPTQTWRHLLLV